MAPVLWWDVPISWEPVPISSADDTTSSKLSTPVDLDLDPELLLIAPWSLLLTSLLSMLFKPWTLPLLVFDIDTAFLSWLLWVLPLLSLMF
jgi:hypothetical protein